MVAMAPGQKKRLRSIILERDGDRCFYCHTKMGEDATLEHLVAAIHGGKNNRANLVLAHGGCNERMGSRPVIEKLRYREARRVVLDTAIEQTQRAQLKFSCRDMVREDLYHWSLVRLEAPKSWLARFFACWGLK